MEKQIELSIIMPVCNEVEVIEKIIRNYYANFLKYCKNYEFIVTEEESQM